ncbi:MAG TPA: MFS transporter [Gemmatimonadaceae bacterium]|nr:MFS transporter [Gemmatimonadaceae bacterium]
MGKLVVLMVTALVDMIGLVMVIPLLPFYAERFGATGAAIGMLIGAFSVAQLVSAPFWGRFSDRRGRRPTLVIGLFTSAVSYLIFAFANSFWLLVVSRVVQGFGGGTVGVVQAYVTDLAAPDDRAKSLGWLSAATSFGAVVGPAAGSLLAGIWGQAAPGLAAALLSLVNMGFAWRYLRESREAASTTTTIRGQGTREALWHVLRNPTTPAARLIWTYTVAIGAFYGMVAVFAQFLQRRFQVDEQTIGYFFMWFGAMGVLTRLALIGPAVKWLGELPLSRVGLVLLGAGMILFPLSHAYLTLWIAMTLMPLGTAFTFPGVTATLSRVVPANERGLYMGVQQSFGGAARGLFPWWDGIAFDRYGMASPFVTAGILCLASIGLALGLEHQVALPEQKPKN